MEYTPLKLPAGWSTCTVCGTIRRDSADHAEFCARMGPKRDPGHIIAKPRPVMRLDQAWVAA